MRHILFFLCIIAMTVIAAVHGTQPDPPKYIEAEADSCIESFDSCFEANGEDIDSCYDCYFFL